MNYTYEELQELLISKQEELDAALEREQALAAHVERLNDLLGMLVDVPELMGGKWESMSRDAIMEKPATSLARRRPTPTS